MRRMKSLKKFINTYKDYPGKPMQPKPGKSPQKILNKVLKERFIEKGWDNETPIFYKDDEDLPEENKEFGKALREYLMRTDNPYSDLVKETKKGPKTLEQRRKEAEADSEN